MIRLLDPPRGKAEGEIWAYSNNPKKGKVPVIFKTDFGHEVFPSDLSEVILELEGDVFVSKRGAQRIERNLLNCYADHRVPAAYYEDFAKARAFNLIIPGCEEYYEKVLAETGDGVLFDSPEYAEQSSNFLRVTPEELESLVLFEVGLYVACQGDAFREQEDSRMIQFRPRVSF
jgi:hypothetical protein